MESLGLMLICLLKGSLPWQQAWHQRKNKPRHKHQKEKQFIHEMKLRTPIETLCQGLPSEFLQYLTECRALEYTQVPDYAGMRGLFLQLFQKGGEKKCLSTVVPYSISALVYFHYVSTAGVHNDGSWVCLHSHHAQRIQLEILPQKLSIKIPEHVLNTCRHPQRTALWAWCILVARLPCMSATRMSTE